MRITRRDISRRLTYIRENIYEEDLKTFAKRIRYTYQHIHKMEHDGVVSINLIIQLAELGISIDWLLTGTGNPVILKFFEKNAKVFSKNVDK
jgi:hypothetical protein